VPDVTISRFSQAPEAPVKRSTDFEAGGGRNVEFKTLKTVGYGAGNTVGRKPTIYYPDLSLCHFAQAVGQLGTDSTSRRKYHSRAGCLSQWQVSAAHVEAKTGHVLRLQAPLEAAAA